MLLTRDSIPTDATQNGHPGRSAIYRSSDQLPAGFSPLPALTAARPAPESAALWFRPCLIDIKRAAVEIRAVKCSDGAVGFRGIGHFHEREATGAAGVAVGYKTDAVHGSVRLKERPERTFSCGKIQIAYKDVFHCFLSVFQLCGRNKAD